MKKSFLITALVAALTSQTVLAVSDTGADNSKQGGTIIFEGQIVETTCHIKDNEGHKRVTLPTVAKTAFKAIGDTAGTVGFTIDLTECKKGTNGGPGFVKAYFYGNEKVNDNGRIINVFTNNTSPIKDTEWNNLVTTPATTLGSITTAAQGIDLQLLDMDGATVIDIRKDGHNTTGQSSQFTAMDEASGSGNLALRYSVRYFATQANVTPGGVRGYVDYILAYK